MGRKLLLTLTGLSLAYFSAVQAEAWGYEGKTGPDKWGGLHKENILCDIGKNQSPIDLSTPLDVNLLPIHLQYKEQKVSIENNGHTIVVTPSVQNQLVIGEQTYQLKQFHFHTASEHTIGGKSYPLEIHFVHANKKGALAVIGLMVDELSGSEGKTAYALDTIVDGLSTDANKVAKTSASLKLSALFPAKLDYYTYNGSLTTPPCSEGVRWLVLKAPVQANSSDIQVLRSIMGQNNRPMQNHNARYLLE